MPSVDRFYTNDYNAGSPTQIFIGITEISPKDAEPVYGGRMEVIDEDPERGRTLLRNPLTGHYWDVRPVHGRWQVAATRDAEARRIFRERRW